MAGQGGVRRLNSSVERRSELTSPPLSHTILPIYQGIERQGATIIGSSTRAPEERTSDLAQVLEELRAVDLSPEALKRRLRPFLDRRAEAIPLLLRQFESEDEERLAVAVAALRAMDDPSLVPLLLKLLQNPHVGDLAKGLLLNLLEHYGFDTRDPSLIGASIDFSEVLKGPGGRQGTE